MLRFKEFNDEWVEKKLGEIFDIKYGKDYKHLKEGDIPVLGTGGIITYVDDFLFQKPSVLVGRKGTINKPFYIDEPFWTVDTLFYTDISNDNPKYVFYCLCTINWFKYNEASGVPSLSANNIKRIKINLPSLNEQEQIADFLSLVDKKIELLEKSYSLYESMKKSFMQGLSSQVIKFKDESGDEYPDWEEKLLSNILFEQKEKSEGGEEVYSVSVHKGIINQIEHLGRKFAAKNISNYNLVKEGDIVYTKSPTGEFPLGIIKQSKIKENVIVSPLYGVFSPQTFELGVFLHEYFESPINAKNYLHPLVQKGAKNTMNISNETFLSKSLSLPINKEEQEKIATFLNYINTKIETLSKYINKNKEFKKGLTQKMFI
ncbi:MAG: restriction endonuclease subunit S [Methanobacteriaceae archaeon]